MDADRAVGIRTVAAHLARGVSDIRQTPVAVIPTKKNADVNHKGNMSEQKSTESKLQQRIILSMKSLLFTLNNLTPGLSMS